MLYTWLEMFHFWNDTILLHRLSSPNLNILKTLKNCHGNFSKMKDLLELLANTKNNNYLSSSIYNCSFLRPCKTVCKLNLYWFEIFFSTRKFLFRHKLWCNAFCKNSLVNSIDQLFGIISISFGISKLGNSLLLSKSNVGLNKFSFSLQK